jgi:hypothetical protein
LGVSLGEGAVVFGIKGYLALVFVCAATTLGSSCEIPTAGQGRLEASPNPVRYGGRAQTLPTSFTNVGTNDAIAESRRFSGIGAASFSISEDRCLGRTIETFRSCTVSITMTRAPSEDAVLQYFDRSSNMIGEVRLDS